MLQKLPGMTPQGFCFSHQHERCEGHFLLLRTRQSAEDLLEILHPSLSCFRLITPIKGRRIIFPELIHASVLSYPSLVILSLRSIHVFQHYCHASQGLNNVVHIISSSHLVNQFKQWLVIKQIKLILQEHLTNACTDSWLVCMAIIHAESFEPLL